ncbi:MAG TPA: CoB--CoM heterodisulfide reductase iron-sulfur subunit A family protein [Desulfobacterales bacterium]|nr:CoB--CoM heterodisulfide reductase iron-sulfur subunit A family protein [Desulfobacterales bacterium]HIP39729.1 CoB--CoM heterodisulfide reductase iron-sulfur subunit A family protein [Desulfocapsa sulfexigens]
MTLSEVTKVTGEVGDFKVTVKEHPRYVDMDKCIACGECAAKCPKKVDDEYNAETGKRKAVYVKYAQAVPLKYQIDANACIWLNKPGKCGACAKVCPADAINFDDTEKNHEIEVGSVILAPGFEAFDPTGTEVFGYGNYPNVITSMQLERYLSASGPTEGHLLRLSDGKPVRKMAFLQCVGSRDENLCGNGYCSSVCCMYAIKEAVIAKDHSPGLQTSIFYMDMRTHGKEFDEYYQRAKNDSGVRFVRCRVNGVEPQGKEGDLRLHYVNEQGQQIEEYFDLVVLSVGLQTPKHVLELAEQTGIRLTAHNFAAVSDFAPVSTSRPGIFTCGAFSGPKDIPQSVMEGSAAAAAAADILSPARNEMTKEKVFPPERNILDEELRIGVFVCHCGSNIAGYVDVEDVADYAATLPGVTHVERNLFTCSQDTQELMVKVIEENNLNRIVVAACTPRTHEALFHETIKAAGLNEYLFEMANIRNQNSWVHTGDKTAATKKAKDLTRMAVAKVAWQGPLQNFSVPITRNALVIGGGLAGMAAASNLAQQGFPVTLVERSSVLGGNANHLHNTWSGEHIPQRVDILIRDIKRNPMITIHAETELMGAEGYVGNFSTTLKNKSGVKQTVEHGVTIVATGATRLLPDEYGYRKQKDVVSSIEFDKLCEINDNKVKTSNSFVFIQCVGSRDADRNYCSKVCCTHSVQSAIDLKKENPNRKVYILYRDMRTYSQREMLYKKAREMGVVFINYELHGKPKVNKKDNGFEVEVWDHILHRPLLITADMIILAAAIIPSAGAKKLSRMYKVPLDNHGFFQEAHAKLRPVDFATEGLFVAGMAHYPKPVEESIAQALAASARAATLLSKEEVTLDGIKAEVDPAHCDGCALCIDVCPYHAITLLEEKNDKGEVHKLVSINKAHCKGCGLCQGTCPKRGVSVAGFTFKQLESQLDAALAM